MFKLFKKKEIPVNPEEEKRKDEIFRQYKHAESREAAICVINNIFTLEEAACLFRCDKRGIEIEIDYIKENGYTEIPEDIRLSHYASRLDLWFKENETAAKIYLHSLNKRTELAHEEFKKDNITLGELSRKYYLSVGGLYESFCEMDNL